MCDCCPAQSVIRSSTKKHLPSCWENTESITNIFLNWAEDENHNQGQRTTPGVMKRSVVTPITWRRKNFAKASIDLSISPTKLGRLRSCARKRSGGVVIAPS